MTIATNPESDGGPSPRQHNADLRASKEQVSEDPWLDILLVDAAPISIFGGFWINDLLDPIAVAGDQPDLKSTAKVKSE